MTHGSLFSGIGGFDLAAEWMGWENLFHCEFNPFCQKILKYYWPNSKSYGDITKSTFIEFRGRIDILTGGFPCQPFSTAGKRKGTDDSRYLWPEMLRVIREVQPRYIVGENVRGLVSWDGGLVFNTVCADLEAEGYEVLPVLLPAASINAPHKRDRIWFIAHSNNKRGNSGFKQVQEQNGEISKRNNNAESCNTSDESITNSKSNGSTICKLGKTETEQQIQTRSNINGFEDMGDASNTSSGISEDKSITEYTNGIGQEWRMHKEQSKTSIRKQFSERNAQSNGQTRWQNFPTVSPICNGDDGLSNRLDSITFSKWRNESIKGGGNAIVPQVALEIFKVIDKLNK